MNPSSDAMKRETKEFKITAIRQSRLLLSALALVMTNVLTASGQSQATSQHADSIAVMANTDTFLNAFRNLEWDRFTEYFAEDATVFFPPSAKQPYRANNKTEILKIFKVVFENARHRRTKAPYIDIDPKDIKVQVLGQAAIVSFTLRDPDMLSRRSFVWVKRNDTWTILHLHGSGIALEVKKD